MKAQALGGDGYKNYIGNKKIMEINCKHLLIKKIIKLLEQGSTFDYEKNIHMIYNISCFSSGFTVTSILDLCTNLYDNLEKEIVLSEKKEDTIQKSNLCL